MYARSVPAENGGLPISADRDCSDKRGIAAAHLDQLQKKFAAVRALESRLKVFVDRCNAACAGGPGQDCMIFKDLAAGNGCGQC